MDHPIETAELRSYGRRRGRRLSARQQGLMTELLPRLAIDLARLPTPLRSLFSVPVRAVWLEIGFGGAEHLLWQARADSEVGLIGCEPFEEGIVKALDGINRDRLGNLRLHANDARDLVRALPDASIERAFVLFPDPWPKARHAKRRLVSTRLLASLARVMAPGAELRLATDIAAYREEMLAAIAATPGFTLLTGSQAEWSHRPADWPPTRYEEKAIKAGRTCAYLRLSRSLSGQSRVVKDRMLR